MPMPTATDLWNIANMNFNDYQQTIGAMFGGQSDFVSEYGEYLDPPDPTQFALFGVAYDNTVEGLNEKFTTGRQEDDVKFQSNLMDTQRTYKDTQDKINTQIGRLGIKAGNLKRSIRRDQSVDKTTISSEITDLNLKRTEAQDSRQDSLKKAHRIKSKGQSQEIQRWFGGTMDRVKTLASLEAFGDEGGSWGTYEDDWWQELWYVQEQQTCEAAGCSYQFSGNYNTGMECWCPGQESGGNNNSSNLFGCHSVWTGQCIPCPDTDCVDGCGSCAL